MDPEYTQLSPLERETIAFDAERLRQDPGFQRGMTRLQERLTERLIMLDPTKDAQEAVTVRAMILAIRALAYEIAVAAMANQDEEADASMMTDNQGQTATRQ